MPCMCVSLVVIDLPLKGTTNYFARIQVHVKRKCAMISVQILSFVNPCRITFDVWDEFTPQAAVQVNGRQQLMVGELMPGATLSMEFEYTNNDYFALHFSRSKRTIR